jgi:hypothetical protein
MSLTFLFIITGGDQIVHKKKGLAVFAKPFFYVKVEPRGEISKQLFKTLEDWNQILEHTSLNKTLIP